VLLVTLLLLLRVLGLKFTVRHGEVRAGAFGRLPIRAVCIADECRSFNAISCS
jgi:hypothetical protein